MTSIEKKYFIDSGCLGRNNAPCSDYLITKWGDLDFIKNYTVLINVHLTDATLLLIDLFLASGANITTTCSPELVMRSEVRTLLSDKVRHVEYNDFINNYIHEDFDVIVDCGGYLADKLQPNIFFVELTHVPSWRYAKTKKPVLNIDASLIKLLETGFGTGDGFVRAIDTVYKQYGKVFTDAKYMIFGFGKVGEGVCFCLNQAGVLKENIIVIEINKKQLSKANKTGYQGYDLYSDIFAIKKLLDFDISCVVTATGIANVISKNLDKSYFDKVDFLTNIGTYDEWGDKFNEDLIENKKRPLNFMLHYPTAIKYLDPVFALLVYATKYCIDNEDEYKNSFSIFTPKLELERELLDVWLKKFPQLKYALSSLLQNKQLIDEV